MSISKEEVKHLADLAKLSFSEEDLNKFTVDLSNIVNLANELNNVDVTNISETAHILNMKNVFRKDEVRTSYDREEMLKNAPTKSSGCISVPKIIE